MAHYTLKNFVILFCENYQCLESGFDTDSEFNSIRIFLVSWRGFGSGCSQIRIQGSAPRTRRFSKYYEMKILNCKMSSFLFYTFVVKCPLRTLPDPNPGWISGSRINGTSDIKGMKMFKA